MYEWAFVNVRSCLLSVSNVPCNIPSFPISNAPVPSLSCIISMVCGFVTMSPAYLCFLYGLWKKLLCRSCCCAVDCPVWPAKGVTHFHWAARSLQTTCNLINKWAKLDILLLCCHFNISLHCMASHIFCKTNLLNEEPILPTSFFLPSYGCFSEWRGLLGVDC